MRPISALGIATLLVVATAAHGGVAWEGALEAGLARAATEGRPILFAINALESEGANDRLHRTIYPSEAWGRATRGYVAFVCNANQHPDHDGPSCGRYGAPLRCEDHIQALTYVLRRFSPVERSLISPQHIVLEPDGGLAYRKEYFTNVVTPELLEELFVRISPELTYEAAGDLRAARIEVLETLSVRKAAAEARAWLTSGDLYAAASVLRTIDFSYDDDRRLRLLETLDDTPRTQLPVLALFADEAGTRPDDRPAEALAMARSLLTIDRAVGTRLLARIACHTKDEGLGRDALQLWLRDAEGRTVKAAQLSPAERAALAEVRLLTGLRREKTDDVEGLPRRLCRAETRAGLRARCYPTIADALVDDSAAGTLRGSLLEATAEEIRSAAAAVEALLVDRPERRVRAAAALALLRGRVGDPELIADRLWDTVLDPVEGEETRAEAERRLGEDPGETWEAWLGAVTRSQHREGGRR